MRRALRALCVCAALAPSSARDVGILYEVWHTRAAQAMGAVAAAGGTQLTTELVIQSNGALTLDDVYGKYNLSADIYNARPSLGFYCLYRKRAGEPTVIPDCENITATARAHAEMLVAGGIDYVAADITNWPIAGQPGGTNDIAVLRPTEVLFEEWSALRASGFPTPSIAVWPCSPAGTSGMSWQWLLQHLYNNPAYESLVYTRGGKKVVFVPHAGANCWDEGARAAIESNGGRNDVTVIPMWALFGDGGGAAWKEGVWGFFSPCTDAAGAFTTSMVGVGPCNQYSSYDNTTQHALQEVSASGGYMLSQCALPFASPGHMRGLTVARLFEAVLERGAPSLFISSFNEYIGGRQAPASHSKVAFNMGLPKDPQRNAVWVDTYASEFSRDIEPSVEGGNKTWLTTVACIALYRAEMTCADAPTSLCCTRDDKEVFANVWSLSLISGGDALLTATQGERDALVGGGGWKEHCSAIASPSAFCVDTAEPDGRSGPFMLYNAANVSDPRDSSGATPMALTPLFRCITPAAQHFFSTQATCEGLGKAESVLGWLSMSPGLETLRALWRCLPPAGEGVGSAVPLFIHALDAACDEVDPRAPAPLGWVR